MAALFGVALLLAPAGASALTIDEYPVEPGALPTAYAPRYIHPGPDGYVWFTTGGARPGFGRIKGEGQRGTFVDIATTRPVDFAVAADGTAYFSGENGLARVEGKAISTDREFTSTYGIALPGDRLRWGEINIGPHVTRYADETWQSSSFASVGFSMQPGQVTSLALSPAGTIWSAFFEANIMLVLTSSLGSTSPSITLPPGSGPKRIVAGPDGNMWVTMQEADAIDRFTPTGARTRIQLPPGSEPNDIAVGPEGNLWFTEMGTSRIGRIKPGSGDLTEFATPTPEAAPFGITAGLDNDVWFTEQAIGKVARLLPNGQPPSGGGSSGGGPPPGGTGGDGKDTTRPRFTKAPAFVPSRFALSAKATPLAARISKGATAPLGSQLELGLSEPAKVTIAIARPSAGRKVAGRCAPASKGNAAKPKCVRYLAVGSLQRSLPDGVSRIPFSGRLGSKALGFGAYRATLVATDAAGNASAPASAGFTLLPPAR